MPPKIEFMQSPRGSWSRSASTAIQKADGGLFWWAISITLLLGLAMFSWMFCLYIFNHPEKPLSYKILSKFQKLETLKAVSEGKATPGKTYDARSLNETFHNFSAEHLAQKNADLHRGYIENYKRDKPLYLKGRFRVISARPLGSSDVFTGGIVARAIALVDGDHEYRNIVLEYILPGKTAKETGFNIGDFIEVDTRSKKRRTYTSIVNVSKEKDDKIVISAVPLSYGTFHIDPARGITIHSEPPTKLNLTGQWPITDDSVGTGPTLATVR